jgi:hypothetical protein
MTSILDTLKPSDAIARRIARAEGRLERMIRGGSSWSGTRDWLAGLRPRGRSSSNRSLSSWAPAWPSSWPSSWTPSRSSDRWPSDAADRVGASGRAIADELMRLGAAAAAPRHRPIGKVVLVAAGLGLLAALARRT